MTGAEIHAQLLDAILTDGVLIRPAGAAAEELGLTIAAGLLVVGFGMRLKPPALAMLLGGVLAALFALSWGAYAGADLLLDVSYPSFAAIALTIVLLGQRLAREQRTGELRE